MLFEKDTIGTLGNRMRVSVDDDGALLTIVDANNDEAVKTIAIDLLVESKFPIALAQAFVDAGGYISLDELLPRQRSQSTGQNIFSLSDAEFSLALETYGIPFPLATRIAYNAKDDSGTVDYSKRQELLTHFFQRGFGVRQENSGFLKSMTTLDIYLFLAASSSTDVADHFTGEVNGSPLGLVEKLTSLQAVLNAGVEIKGLTSSHLGAISTIITEKFPSKSLSEERRIIQMNALIKFLCGPHNYRKVARINRETSLLRLDLSHELMRFTSGTLLDNPIGNENTKALASVFTATYGEELMVNALNGFHAQERFLNMSSPHVFSAFTAYVEHLAEDGDPTMAIDWIIALHPEISEENLLKRGMK